MDSKGGKGAFQVQGTVVGRCGGAALRVLCGVCQELRKDGGPAAAGGAGGRGQGVGLETGAGVRREAGELGLCAKGRESQAGFRAGGLSGRTPVAGVRRVPRSLVRRPGGCRGGPGERWRLGVRW